MGGLPSETDLFFLRVQSDAKADDDLVLVRKQEAVQDGETAMVRSGGN